MTSEPLSGLGQVTAGLNRLTTEIRRAGEEAGAAEVAGSSPDGTVRAVLRGGRLVDLTIAPAALEDLDATRLARQVMTAVQDAQQRADEAVRSRTAPLEDLMQRMFDGIDG